MYQIDAFADRAFTGNPAAVIPLQEWIPDALMQAIAAENNLSETAFFVPTAQGFHIRWFTPNKEVKLCGHATLASAFVLFNILAYPADSIHFDSLSGPLAVVKNDSLLTLDFPTQKPEPCDIPEALVHGLGKTPSACYRNEDLVAIFEQEEDIAAMQPKFAELEKLNLRGVIITAPSRKNDFVARFFAPKFGIPEDPVTGSAYTQLTPYWAERLGKNKLTAKQLSARGGMVYCELKGDRVLISGSAIKFMEGEIEV
nr:PhzF family phenazine biosynthesis protein [Candidatus Electrothrix aestuarii]